MSATLSNVTSYRRQIDDLLYQMREWDKRGRTASNEAEAMFTSVIAMSLVILKRIRLSDRDDEREFTNDLAKNAGDGPEHKLLNWVRNETGGKLLADTRRNQQHGIMVKCLRWLNNPIHYNPSPATIQVEDVVEHVRSFDTDKDAMDGVSVLAKKQDNWTAEEGRRIKDEAARQEEEQRVAREKLRALSEGINPETDENWSVHLAELDASREAATRAADRSKLLEQAIETLVANAVEFEPAEQVIRGRLYVGGDNGKLMVIADRRRDDLLYPERDQGTAIFANLLRS